MGKQKILMVHNYYQIPGGEDMVVANEKEMLEKQGHKVFLYSRDNSELKTFTKLQKLCLPFSTIFNIRTYREVKKIIKEKKIDIVHVHNTLSLISPSVYYAALKCKVPVVQTVHNFRFLCPSAVFYRDGHVCEDCVNYRLWHAVKHKCYRNSRIQTLACVVNTKIHRMTGIYGKINYICLTEFNKEKLLQMKQIKQEKIFVKPNFVNSISIAGNLGERKDRFIYAGRLDRLKGIEVLFQAWKLLGNSASELVACGNGNMEAWCREYQKKNNLTSIKLKGLVSNMEVRQMIADSKALILPTQWYEGFPVNIVEAFSVGTPVICSDFGNTGDLVREGITGCKFRCNSPDELVQAIKRIKNYKNIYQTTKDEYKKKYTEDINYEMLMTVYKCCLKEEDVIEK